jgi:hypothetical protein
MKECNYCGEIKSEDCFHQRAKSQDGLDYGCKQCRKERDAVRYKNDPDKFKHQCKSWSKTLPGRYRAYKQGAELRGFTIFSQKEFSFFWQKPCQYCGDIIDTVGIDRVDSTKNYTLENCVACCATCNRMKLDLTYENWISHMQKILSKLS